MTNQTSTKKCPPKKKSKRIVGRRKNVHQNLVYQKHVGENWNNDPASIQPTREARSTTSSVLSKLWGAIAPLHLILLLK